MFFSSLHYAHLSSSIVKKVLKILQMWEKMYSNTRFIWSSETLTCFCLQQIQRELLETEQKVDSLQELSGQLLVQTHGGECLEAQERVHVIGNRLQLLLKAVATDMELLEKELQASGNRQVSLQAHSIFIHLFTDHLFGFNR